ncbi:hypothetical protein B0H19DRAFT_1086435 [Mycena capillaripes]|nr:hypothetical protein B0H19DRAFT_1086435 [Mycena capillaripes]
MSGNELFRSAPDLRPVITIITYQMTWSYGMLSLIPHSGRLRYCAFRAFSGLSNGKRFRVLPSLIEGRRLIWIKRLARSRKHPIKHISKHGICNADQCQEIADPHRVAVAREPGSVTGPFAVHNAGPAGLDCTIVMSHIPEFSEIALGHGLDMDEFGGPGKVVIGVAGPPSIN